MLKRQRASSPSPLSQATAMEVPLPSSDPTSSEHGAKRRRILAPSLDGASSGWGQSPILSEDDTDNDDTMGDDTLNPWPITAERSLGGAGEYKTVNSLLHDLHAEQQHRRLMSLSLHSSSSSPRPFSQGWSSSNPQQPPAGKPHLAPHPYANFIQDVPPAGKYWQEVHANEAMNRVSDGDASVHDWYEETNRSGRFLPTSHCPSLLPRSGFWGQPSWNADGTSPLWAYKLSIWIDL